MKMILKWVIVRDKFYLISSHNLPCHYLSHNLPCHLQPSYDHLIIYHVRCQRLVWLEVVWWGEVSLKYHALKFEKMMMVDDVQLTILASSHLSFTILLSLIYHLISSFLGIESVYERYEFRGSFKRWWLMRWLMRDEMRDGWWDRLFTSYY